MADPIQVQNSAEQLDDTTLLQGETDQEVTGLKDFRRAPGPPFGVEAGSAAVPNLDADKLDGEEGSDFHDASKLSAGTVPAARFPAILPPVSGAALTSLPASALVGEVPAASFPDPLPAKSGALLTAVPDPLPATSLENCNSIPADELVGDIPDASVPAYVDARIAQFATISRGGTIVNPAGITAGMFIQVWRVTQACHVTKVWGIRAGGSGATVNASRNGLTENFLASDLSLTSAGVYTDGGAVQNTALVAGDLLVIRLVTVSGSPTAVGIQVDITIDPPA